MHRNSTTNFLNCLRRLRYRFTKIQAARAVTRLMRVALGAASFLQAIASAFGGIAPSNSEIYNGIFIVFRVS
jgi:hypothetical protein